MLKKTYREHKKQPLQIPELLVLENRIQPELGFQRTIHYWTPSRGKLQVQNSLVLVLKKTQFPAFQPFLYLRVIFFIFNAKWLVQIPRAKHIGVNDSVHKLGHVLVTSSNKPHDDDTVLRGIWWCWRWWVGRDWRCRIRGANKNSHWLGFEVWNMGIHRWIVRKVEYLGSVSIRNCICRYVLFFGGGGSRWQSRSRTPLIELGQFAKPIIRVQNSIEMVAKSINFGKSHCYCPVYTLGYTVSSPLSGARWGRVTERVTRRVPIARSINFSLCLLYFKKFTYKQILK